MYKNERRFRDAIMPDVVTDGTKRYEVPEKWKPSNIVRKRDTGGRCWLFCGGLPKCFSILSLYNS